MDDIWHTAEGYSVPHSAKSTLLPMCPLVEISVPPARSQVGLMLVASYLTPGFDASQGTESHRRKQWLFMWDRRTMSDMEGEFDQDNE